MVYTGADVTPPAPAPSPAAGSPDYAPLLAPGPSPSAQPFGLPPSTVVTWLPANTSLMCEMTTVDELPPGWAQVSKNNMEDCRGPGLGDIPHGVR